MLTKWITCKVGAEAKNAFSYSQSGWGDLVAVPGFVAQIGGWAAEDAEEACIVAFWKDEMAYKNFMENYHDRICENNGQKGTYRSIAVQLSEQPLDVAQAKAVIASAQATGRLVWEGRTILMEPSWTVLAEGNA